MAKFPVTVVCSDNNERATAIVEAENIDEARWTVEQWIGAWDENVTYFIEVPFCPQLPNWMD